MTNRTPTIAAQNAQNALTTTFVNVDDMVQIVQRKGLTACLVGVADRIEKEFLRWEAFDKSARLAFHSTDGVVELMPIADDRQFSFKYVNGHPKNTRFGLPTVMAFGLIADVDTGAPRFLSELTLTTAIRTAAMSALAAKKLARPNSRTMALIGNGAQSEFQALAFRDIVGIDTLHLFDVDPAATAKLVSNLQGQGLTLKVFASTAEAVKGVDIITTVTADKTNATIITPEMIEPGMHVNGVGGDCPGKTELHRGVLELGAVFCEFEPQSRVEGDMQQMPADFPVTEFWRVLSGQAAGRVSAEQVTVFDSVGFALEDFAALAFMQDAARELNIGQPIVLVPQSEDPKNLFGLLRTQPTARVLPLSAKQAA